MAFCATCGAPVEGRFCAKCGSAVNAGTPPPAAGPAPSAGPAGAQPMAAPMADNVASMLCYVLGFITGIIFLVLEPYNKNRAIRFHAFQSIFLNVAIIAVEIVLGIFFRILLAAIGLFGLLTGVVFPLFWLACFALWLYLLFATYQGKTVVLPIIGPFAQKQA